MDIFFFAMSMQPCIFRTCDQQLNRKNFDSNNFFCFYTVKLKYALSFLKCPSQVSSSCLWRHIMVTTKIGAFVPFTMFNYIVQQQHFPVIASKNNREKKSSRYSWISLFIVGRNFLTSILSIWATMMNNYFLYSIVTFIGDRKRCSTLLWHDIFIIVRNIWHIKLFLIKFQSMFVINILNTKMLLNSLAQKYFIRSYKN